MNTISQVATDYWNDIPQRSLIQMFYAAGGGFFLETIFTSDIKKGAIVAALSGLATAIHALVTPLFKRLTGGRLQLTMAEEICRTFSGIIGAGLVEKAFGNDSIFKRLWIEAIIECLIITLNPARANLLNTNIITIYPAGADLKQT